jgi:hypothetical protein
MTKAFLGIALWAGITGLKVWAEGTPKIQFDKTVYDFGKTSQVERVTGSFTFRNAGDGVLKLEKPTTSCGCTVADVKPDSLQPGEKGELTFTLDMPSVRSLLEKTITVNSNDPQNPKLDLKIKTDYVPLFEFNPRLVRFDIRAGSETNAMLVVKRTDGKKLNVTKIEVSKPWIIAALDTSVKSDDQTARVSIRAKPDGSPRQISEYLRVFVDNSENPAVTFFVNGRVLGDIAVTPEVLFWNITDREALKKPEADALRSRRLVATSTILGQSFELSNPSSSIPELSLKLIPQKKDKTYEIVATLTNVPTETVRGMISLDSNLPSQPRIWLPVTIIVVKTDPLK